MAHSIVHDLLATMEALRSAFTAPGYANLVALLVGGWLTTGPHTVTAALVAAGLAGRCHHERFHRFLSRGIWSPDELGRLLLAVVLAVLPPAGGVLRVVIDDTLADKKGAHIFGLASHLDPVRSTKRHKSFCFGHVWVVLALVVPVPFSTRVWALPLLFRLYRGKKECAAHGGTYRKKTELAREMQDVLDGWCDGKRRLEVALDSGYSNDTVLRGLPARIVVFGAMRPDAVLTAPPVSRRKGQRGRPRLRGEPLPKPEALARDPGVPWSTLTATLYGVTREVAYKTLVGVWFAASRTHLLRVVVVRCTSGALPYRVFFCTDAAVAVLDLLTIYAGRWSIEVCFRDLKQHAGFADSPARKQKAVERAAPLAGYSYVLLVLWFAQGAWRSELAAVPVRPWYTDKRGLCFADIVRTARRALQGADLFAILVQHPELQKSIPSTPPPEPIHAMAA